MLTSVYGLLGEVTSGNRVMTHCFFERYKDTKMNIVHENKENNFIHSQIEESEYDVTVGKASNYVTLGISEYILHS